MLTLLLVAQLQSLPQTTLSLPPVTLDSERRLEGLWQKQWLTTLEEQQRQLNLNQQTYQVERRKLNESLPPSRVDCYPLFPPVSGYPPGTDVISCHRP